MNIVYPIPWIKGYGITKDGRVWSYPKERSSTSGKWLKPSITNSGYKFVHCGNAHKNQSIHRLLAKMFISNTKNKPCVNHKNGIKTDNHVENFSAAGIYKAMQREGLI